MVASGVEAPRRSRLAIAVLVAGIAALATFCAPMDLAAVVLGVIALGRISASDTQLTGRGIAITSATA